MDITRQPKAYLLYRSDVSILRDVCSAEERAKIYLAIEEWFFSGNIDPEMESNFAFHSIKAKIEQHQAEEEAKNERYRQYGYLGGRPKKQVTEKPEGLEKTHRLNENPQVTDETHRLLKNLQVIEKPNGFEKKEENKEKESFPPHPLYKEKETKEEKSLLVNDVDRTRDFDIFWEAYNKKVGKAAALKAYAKATQAKSFPGIEKLVDIVYAWRGSRSWREGYQPHPATWLNGERWLDDLNSDSLPTEQEQDNTPPPMLLKTEYHIVEC